ncbi:MAG: hypothetical protein ACI4KI_03745 [Candidatus Fimenecus sp.]
MVKGVNKQVLEIHETGCDYFEKALFFIKPEYSAQSDGRLKGSALKAIQSSAAVPKTRRQKIKSRLLFIFEMAASAGLGATITAILLK